MDQITDYSEEGGKKQKEIFFVFNSLICHGLWYSGSISA